MKIEDCFRIGSILKTKGLKGEMQFYVDFDRLDEIDFKAIFVEIGGKLAPFFVQSIKYNHNNQAYLYLEDIDTVEKAAALIKKNVYLPNKLKPARDEDDFTLFDLVGFTAIDEDEGELGEIIDVQEYPQQIIATVDFKGQEVLFPLNEDIITGIDVAQEILNVNLPEGLLDIYLD